MKKGVSSAAHTRARVILSAPPPPGVVLPKKGDVMECSNYRTLSLLNHTCKVLLFILLERLKSQIDPFLAEEQAGFRRERSTTQHSSF